MVNFAVSRGVGYIGLKRKAVPATVKVNQMKVLKFGGTSVGKPESLRNVVGIVERISEPAIVVVSALGGLTDKLIQTAHMAAAGDRSYVDVMESMAQRHRDMIDEMLPDSSAREDVKSAIEPMLAELGRIYDGVAMIGDLPRRTLDVIVSFGERMSSVLVSRAIRGARHYDSLQFVKTERWFNKDIADSRLTDSLIRDTFAGLGEGVAVCGGFISTDRDTGDITNLGRGGSDFTAALIAAALGADVLEIWTDVDGFMTADPRIIKEAEVIDHLSFVESMELCSFGAKVIYPPTIYPVFHKNIPIRILNTFNPDAPGTWITDAGTGAEAVVNEDSVVKGVSAIRDTVLVRVSGSCTANVAEINTRTFNALAKQGVSVYLVSQPCEGSDFSFAVSACDGDKTIRVLEDEFAPELAAGSVDCISLTEDLATIAVVGENINSRPRMGARVLNTLQRAGMEVVASSYGTSATTIALVVRRSDADCALRELHASFFSK